VGSNFSQVVCASFSVMDLKLSIPRVFPSGEVLVGDGSRYMSLAWQNIKVYHLCLYIDSRKAIRELEPFLSGTEEEAPTTDLSLHGRVLNGRFRKVFHLVVAKVSWQSRMQQALRVPMMKNLPTDLASEGEKVVSAIPLMKEGDTMTWIISSCGEHLEFRHNGKMLLELDNSAVCHALQAIWLQGGTDPELRSALLRDLPAVVMRETEALAEELEAAELELDEAEGEAPAQPHREEAPSPMLRFTSKTLTSGTRTFNQVKDIEAKDKGVIQMRHEMARLRSRINEAEARLEAAPDLSRVCFRVGAIGGAVAVICVVILVNAFATLRRFELSILVTALVPLVCYASFLSPELLHGLERMRPLETAEASAFDLPDLTKEERDLARSMTSEKFRRRGNTRPLVE